MPFPGAGVQQLYDVERIEVLKGPQGSLFGRNSSTGLVQFVTRKPTDEFGGYASLSIGQYGKIGGEGALNLPLGEGARVRIAGQYSHNDGYRRNPETGIDTFGKEIGRAQSELQSLMRISYAVFCLKKKKKEKPCNQH